MNLRLHPAVTIIKNEIIRGKYRYEDVAAGSGISVHRLKNVMAGRSDMTIRERDQLCDYLKISPVAVVMRRDDLSDMASHLDLTELPEGMRKRLIDLHNEILQLYKKMNGKVDP